MRTLGIALMLRSQKGALLNYNSIVLWIQIQIRIQCQTQSQSQTQIQNQIFILKDDTAFYETHKALKCCAKIYACRTCDESCIVSIYD